MVIVHGGGGDAFVATPAAEVLTPEEVAGLVQTTATTAVRPLGMQMLRLNTVGGDDFVLPNLPDGSADSISLGNGFSLALDVALSQAAIQLQQQTSTNILGVDANGILRDIVATPSRYGVVNTADVRITAPACVLGGSATQKSFRFFDNVHPTTGIHAQVAALLAETIQAPATVAARGDVTLLAGQDFQRRLIAAFNSARATASLALSDGGTAADATTDHDAGSLFLVPTIPMVTAMRAAGR